MADPMTALMTDRIADQNCDVGSVLHSHVMWENSLTYFFRDITERGGFSSR